MLESDRFDVVELNVLRMDMLEIPEQLALGFWAKRNIPDRQQGASITVNYSMFRFG